MNNYFIKDKKFKNKKLFIIFFLNESKKNIT